MTGIFLMATQKIFQVILKIWPKIFFGFFFNRKSIFVRKQTFFEEKKILHAKFNILCIT